MVDERAAPLSSAVHPARSFARGVTGWGLDRRNPGFWLVAEPMSAAMPDFAEQKMSARHFLRPIGRHAAITRLRRQVDELPRLVCPTDASRAITDRTPPPSRPAVIPFAKGTTGCCWTDWLANVPFGAASGGSSRPLAIPGCATAVRGALSSFRSASDSRRIVAARKSAASCHLRTHAAQQKALSFDHLIGADEERGRLALAVFRLMTSLLWSASAPASQPVRLCECVRGSPTGYRRNTQRRSRDRRLVL
jgi:hypothetical protein